MNRRPVTKSPYEMLNPETALGIVLDNTPILPPVEMATAEAGGSILAADVLAREPVPPFRAAVKDGYAVVASDGPGEYPVVGDAHAGWLSDFTVRSGTVAYVTTGAPMPNGADAVVMVEDTETVRHDEGGTVVRIRHAVQPGHEVRPIGLDVAADQVVLNAGDRVTAAEIGMLATVGLSVVSVHRSPTVAVLSTGDELVDIGETLSAGKIRDSNRPMLIEAVRESHGLPIDLGIARDDSLELAQLVERGLTEADVLITSGGVSMGDKDFIKPILERNGTIHFGRIRLKPGKPLTFATVEVDGQRRLAFGLPGNPVSSLVTYHLFVVPCLRKMMGMADPMLQRVQVHLAERLERDPERTEYHRATLRWERDLNGGAGGYRAFSTGNQTSSRLLSMHMASALLELPAGEVPLAAGAIVDALVIGRCQS